MAKISFTAFAVLTITLLLFNLFYTINVKADIYDPILGNITQEQQSSMSNWFSLFMDFVGRIGSFFSGLMDFVSKSFSHVGDIFKGFTESISFIGSFLGNWGDPSEYNKIMVYSLTFPALRESIVNCSTNRSVIYTTRQLGLNDLPENFCDYFNKIAPTGVLGYIHYVIYVISVSKDIMVFVIRNFLFIVSSISIFIMVIGLEQSIKKKSIEPLIKSFEFMFKLFYYPFKVLIWLAEQLLKVIQVIANLIEAILPF